MMVKISIKKKIFFDVHDQVTLQGHPEKDKNDPFVPKKEIITPIVPKKEIQPKIEKKLAVNEGH